jgi:hypothetical protein
MKLAKSCGLTVHECFIKTIKDKNFYVVERYDREKTTDSGQEYIKKIFAKY